MNFTFPKDTLPESTFSLGLAVTYGADGAVTKVACMCKKIMQKVVAQSVPITVSAVDNPIIQDPIKIPYNPYSGVFTFTEDNKAIRYLGSSLGSDGHYHLFDGVAHGVSCTEHIYK